MSETTIAALGFEARMDGAMTRGECAHITFPEVIGQDWLCQLIAGTIGALGELATTEGITLERLAEAAEHALVMVAGAGIAAGQSLASESLFELSEVDWDNLPNVLEGND